MSLPSQLLGARGRKVIVGLRSWRRRGDERREDDTVAADAGEASADLANPDSEPLNPFGEEHAWWAERDRLQRVFVSSGEETTSDTKDRPLNDFWSPESLFTYDRRGFEEQDGVEEIVDPYAVLGLPVYATWADVTAAHRHLAKRYHPDRMLDASDGERQHAEQQMRLINQAYSQLQRVRKSVVG
jgi:hypothetical protein